MATLVAHASLPQHPAAPRHGHAAAIATGVAAAVAGSGVVYGAARALGVPFSMAMMPGTDPIVLPIGMVVTMSLLGALLGTAAFLVLSRFGPRGLRAFRLLGAAFLLLSFAGPLGLEASDAATKASLILMHVAAGVPIIAILGASRRA